MSWHLGHPDPETLASFSRSRRIAAHAMRCPRCAAVCEQLDAVGAALASAPVPPLPEHAEKRILSAIDAEAARRQAVLQQGPEQDPGEQDRNRVRTGGPRRVAVVLVSVTACLLLAGLGYVLSGPGTPSASPTEAVPAPGPAAARSAATESAAGRAESGHSYSNVRTENGPGRQVLGPAVSGPSPAFLVTDSGMNYTRETLRAQVRERLSGQGTRSPGTEPPGTEPPGSSVHASGPSAAGGQGTEVAPSSQLVGCVLHLTGGMPPSFVDRATYQDKPVYVFAVPSEAWVVGAGCTAAHPALITSVRLVTTG